MNFILLIGKIADIDGDLDSDKLNTTMTIKVERTFQESDGQYTFDLFKIRIWRGMAETILTNYHIGDTVGVKGRMQHMKNGEMIIIAEKVSFIAYEEKSN